MRVVLLVEAEFGNSILNNEFRAAGANIPPSMGQRSEAAAMHGVNDLNLDLFGFLGQGDRAAASGLMFA